MRQLFYWTPILILSLIFSGPTPAAHAGRPLNTDDTGVVAPGSLEIETAYEYADTSDEENTLSVVLTTGLLDTLDIGVEIPYQFIELADSQNEEGISDIGLTTKWNFLQDEDLFDMTLSFGYKSDNGNDEKSLGTGEAEYTILAIVSKTFSDTTVHVNLGPTIVRNGDDVLNYNLAGEWGVTDELSLVGEIFASHNLQDDFDDNAMSGLVGFTYQVHEAVVYDLGLAWGISESEPDFKVTTGLTIAFGE